MNKEELLAIFKKERESLEDAYQCPRARCECLAVTDEDCPSFVYGFNQHVGESTCVIEDNHCVSAIHAEVDMVASSARKGISLEKATVYSLERPCQRCLVTMYQAGIRKVYYVNDYHTKAHGSEFCSLLLMVLMEVKMLSE